MTVRKRLAFTAAMLLIPIAFFAMVEGALRLAGVGDSYPLFVPVEGKPNYLYQNREVARRYFTQIENVPTSLADFFEAKKDSTTFRIFVQGGSSGAGFPFYHGGSFSRMLEQRLIQTFPERHIEVINTSMAAVNSYTLLDLTREIIAQEPDAVLIYAGHNEYYGALGVGSSETLGGRPWLIRSYLALADLRVTQALRRLLSWAAQITAQRATGEAPSGTLMSRMVGKQSIAYGSGDFDRGLRQFRSNLSRLLRVYADRGIPVYIGTLASNERDHAPFVTGFLPETPRAEWERHYGAALSAAGSGDTDGALASLERAIALDSLQADAYFTRGQVLERAGRFDEARASYLAAKDRDELRFRAPEAMNAIIREEAERFGATVVETQRTLAEKSENGIVGSAVMIEHLHPNVNGYFAIADAFYDALRRDALIGSWVNTIPEELARQEILLTAADSLAGVFRVRQLMASWPFQEPGVTKPWIDSVDADDPVTRIALDLYRGEVSWLEANDALRRHHESRGNYHAALRAALAQIQEYPFVAKPYLAAGNALMKEDRYDEALTYFEAANRQEETALGHRMAGSILLHRGRHGQALDHLERAVALDPADGTTLYNLSGAYATDGRYDEARETVNRLLELHPNHQEARRLLASLPPD